MGWWWRAITNIRDRKTTHKAQKGNIHTQFTVHGTFIFRLTDGTVLVLCWVEGEANVNHLILNNMYSKNKREKGKKREFYRFVLLPFLVIPQNDNEFYLLGSILITTAPPVLLLCLACFGWIKLNRSVWWWWHSKRVTTKSEEKKNTEQFDYFTLFPHFSLYSDMCPMDRVFFFILLFFLRALDDVKWAKRQVSERKTLSFHRCWYFIQWQ